MKTSNTSLFLLLLWLLPIGSNYAQKVDAYDLGITPNSHLCEKNHIDYCIRNNKFSIKHLLINNDKDFRNFLKYADKLKHIDSLSIGREGNLCKLIYEFENRVLETMPDLPELPNLKFLSVMVVSMKYPPKNLGSFKKLKFLELVGEFDEIPSSLWELSSLEKLHLSGLFTEVSPKVYQLPMLQVLTLEGKYKTLPPMPAKNRKIEYLRLSGFLNKIPPIIENTPNLRYLKVLSDEPFAISDNIKFIPSVEEFRFENTVITSISGEIQHLDKLQAIYFNNSWIKELPAHVFMPRNLTDLRLDISASDVALEEFMDPKYYPFPQIILPKTIPFNPSIEYIDLMDRPISKENFNRLVEIYSFDVVEY